jgi:peptidoglycan/xylan/chitin deacetylase (PgdA/CDA1 family)
VNDAASLPTFAGVCLTFDDGPDPTWTPRCLDVLAEANARATFFMIGAQARRHSGLVRRIARAGHMIGNHTLTHAHPWAMSSRRAVDEVCNGAIAIADVLGALPKFFRPPHGAKRRCMIDAAAEQGEALVMWDVSAVDWGWLGTAPRIAKRLARVTDGSIVLMHDGANRHNRPDQMLRVLPGFLQARAAMLM